MLRHSTPKMIGKHPARHLILIGMWLLLLVCLGPIAPIAAGELEQKIDALISVPEYKGGRWGILVVDAESGQPVYERNADMLFAPASVTKLYSCAAALIALG